VRCYVKDLIVSGWRLSRSDQARGKPSSRTASEDKTIDPPTSAIFTLVNQTDSLPIPLDRLPLYRKDYIGLRALDKRGALDRDRVCLGEHMQIVRSGSWSTLTLQDEACWTMVLDELASSSKATDVRG